MPTPAPASTARPAVRPADLDGFAARHLLPPARDRAAWAALMAHPLDQRRAAQVRAEAAARRTMPWPRLPATLYMDLSRSGARKPYQVAYQARRTILYTLVLAACVDGAEQWIDAIVDAIWSICEETTWCIPAHSGQRTPDRTPEVLPAPEPSAQMPDLFVGETAALLAEACSLLADELDAVTPRVRQRVRYECRRRFLAPATSAEPFWWRLGLNNWSAWIAANLVITGGNLAEDAVELAAVVAAALEAIDNWMAFYPADGGCDEGLTYWGAGPGCALVLDEELRRRSDGRLGLDPDRLQAMGRFPLAIHLGGGCFPCFADSKMTELPTPALLAGFARLHHDEELMAMAGLAARDFTPAAEAETGLRFVTNLSGMCLSRNLRAWAWTPGPDLAAPPSAPWPRGDDWLSELQVATMRAPHLACCAKAGHNSENHNHNDLGQFVLAVDGQAVIIDPGTGTYDGRSFSARRYEHWYNASRGHAVPVIDGHEQCSGRSFAPEETALLYRDGPAAIFADPPYRAREVEFTTDADTARLTMDLTEAYPAAAGLTRVYRCITLDRAGECLEVADRVCTDAARGCAEPVVTLCLTSPRAPTADGDDLVWDLPGARRVRLRCDRLATEVARRDLGDDTDLQRSWGSTLWHIHLRATGTAHEAAYRLGFSVEER